MTSVLLKDAITGGTIAFIAVLAFILILYGMVKNYRHERLVITSEEREKVRRREHELMILDAERQNKELEIGKLKLLPAAERPKVYYFGEGDD